MADGTVIIRVDDNADESAKSFKRLDNSLNKVEKSAKDVDGTIFTLSNTIKTAIGVVAVSEVARFGNELLGFASSAEETSNKLTQTFGAFEKQAVSAANALAESYNLADQEAQSLLSNTGALLKGFGFTEEQSLDLSTSIQRLSADLTSFNDFTGGAAQASEILTKALLGETDALVSLGTKLNVSDLKEYAEAQGFVFEELSRAQRAALTFNAILDQNKDAIGDVERSNDSYANTSRRLQSAITNLKTEIGNELLPVFTKLAEDFSNFASDPSIVRGFTSIGTAVAETVKGIVSAVGVVGDAVDTLSITFNSVVRDFANIRLSSVNDDIRETEKVVSDLKQTVSEGGGFLDGIIGASAEDRLEIFQKRLDDLKVKRDELLADSQGSQSNIDAILSSIEATKNELKESADASEDLGGNLERISNETIDSLRGGVEQISSEISKLSDVAATTFKDVGESAKLSITQDLSAALTTPFKEGETAAQRFGSVVLGIVQQIAQQIVAKQIAGLFLGGLGASSGAVQVGTTPTQVPTTPSSLTDIFGSINANGNAFSGGNVQAFKDGGAFTNSIVDRPTFFPMANGKTGLMGEAGEEAIMPLKRDGSGRLGVDASGAGSTVNIINQSGAQIESVSRPGGDTDVFVRRVSSVIASERAQSAFGVGLQRQQQNGLQAV